MTYQVQIEVLNNFYVRIALSREDDWNARFSLRVEEAAFDGLVHFNEVALVHDVVVAHVTVDSV